MANLPYINGNENKVLGMLKMYARMGQFPLDPTSVFNTKEELLEYINEPGSYAYPGQVVAVANGDINNAELTNDYSLFIIRSDKTPQELGKNLTFSSIDLATEFVNNNKATVHPGELVTVADETNGYALYIIKDDYSLHRASFESGDIPDVSWATLQGKPESEVSDIDDAVAKKHGHSNKDILDALMNIDGRIGQGSNAFAYKSELNWENIADKPTDLGGLGINNVYTSEQADNLFIKKEEVSIIPDAGKILRLDDNAQIPASVLSGTIPLANLPHGAVERCVVVPNDDARFALTMEEVQIGDTVKVTETGFMYFVVDNAKLNEDAGYEIYSAAAASTVPWAGVTDKPNTILGYGITDAVSSTEVSTTAEPEKLLKLDAEGKLPADITGDASTVGGKSATDFVLATDVVTSAEPEKLLKLDAEGKLPADITGDASTVGGKSATDFVLATDVVTSAEPEKLLKLDAEGKLPADITGTAAKVDWSGVENKPNTLGGYGITDAVSNADIVTVATPNKVLKLNESGELPANITGNAATATNVDWSGVQNKPNTLGGYGITDSYTNTHINENFVNKSEVSTVPEANKLLKLNEEAKLATDITGNAATATNVDWSGVQNTPATLAEYGITDAYNKTQSDDTFVLKTDVVDTAAPNKLLKLDSEGKLPVSVLSGTIPLANLPHGALERCYVAASDIARFQLTNLQVQNGDTVKVENTGKMYFVVDDTKLGSEAGYEIYTATAATTVPWSGVTDTPTTLSGYGITDVFTKDESNTNFVSVANTVTEGNVDNAGKLVKLNGEGKLNVDITGNAATATNVEWSGVQNKPTTLSGYGITDGLSTETANTLFVSVEEVVTGPVANKLLKLNADGKLPADITGTAGAVAWGNIIGKPSSEAAEIDDAVTKRHDHTNKADIDKISTDENGRMIFNQTNMVAYVSDITSIISVGAENPDETMPVGGLWFDTSVNVVQ